MAMEEKQLLLKDLCARLPYGVKVKFYSMEYPYGSEPVILTVHLLKDRWENIHDVKPYLRTMSSMTKEEKEELESISSFYFNNALDAQIQESLKGENKDGSRILEYVACTKVTDWLLEHHFDINGLVEKGLAIEATEEMYNFKK